MFLAGAVIFLVVLGISVGIAQTLGAFAGVAITALVAWLVARRTSSGSVSTSDAKTLWDAAETIRQEQSAEIKHLRERVVVLEATVRDEAQRREMAEKRVTALEHEVDMLRGAIGD